MAANEPMLTPEQKKKTIEDIKLLDKEGKDNLYMIIRHSANIEKDDKVFNGKYGKKGVMFDLDSFPDELQKMVYLFTKRHLEETAGSQAAVEIVFS